MQIAGTVQVVDFNSLAASRAKTIPPDADDNVYPYLVGVVNCQDA